MKQGLYGPMPIEVEIDHNSVKKIEFKFEQGCAERLFVYPSDEVSYDADRNCYDLVWQKADTYLFHPTVDIKLDTRITLNGTDYQPEAINIRFKMAPTLFKETE